MRPRRLRGISRGFPRLSPCGGQVPYVLLTRAPVAGGRVAAPPAAPRLACVRPVASVHPEPGSNSSLFIFYLLFFLLFLRFPGGRIISAAGVVLSRVSRSICLFPAAAPGGRSSAASFQCTIPGPQGRLAKLTTIPRFSKLPPHFSQQPGRRFPFAVAKVLPFPALFQIFRRLFFIFFHTLRARPCLSRPCTRNFFSLKTQKTLHNHENTFLTLDFRLISLTLFNIHAAIFFCFHAIKCNNTTIGIKKNTNVNHKKRQKTRYLKWQQGLSLKFNKKIKPTEQLAYRFWHQAPCRAYTSHNHYCQSSSNCR